MHWKVENGLFMCVWRLLACIKGCRHFVFEQDLFLSVCACGTLAVSCMCAYCVGTHLNLVSCMYGYCVVYTCRPFVMYLQLLCCVHV